MSFGAIIPIWQKAVEKWGIFVENQLLITEKDRHIITAWSEEGRICQIHADALGQEGILGNIYVGKVRNIVKNINAAFVEFQKGHMGYLSLKSSFCPIHTDGRRQEDGRVLIGDEILVQVEKEAVKTKPPTLTGTWDLSGRFVVLSVGNNKISISHKIRDKETRQNLHDILEQYGQAKEYGWIARTNSKNATKEELIQEMENLIKGYENIVHYGKHKTPFTCLYQAPPAYLSSLRDVYGSRIRQVVTDREEIYESVKQFLEENHWQDFMEVSLWSEEHGKMDAVYDISKTMDKALKKKVWLKSGAYLIIEPTEALVSIDVNTGKAISKKKDVENTFRKVNLEAAKEISLQLRLRNLSGMILVDFIDMKQEEHKEELLETFRRELGKDPVPATLVDMTKLGLVEVTRKKVRKPLYDQLTSGEEQEQ